MKKENSPIEKQNLSSSNYGVIGQGILGRVYIANHKKTGKKVALKVISNQNLKTSARKRLYLNEVKTLKCLKGKTNIVDFIQSFELSNNVCIAMELCEKGTLRQMMNNGPLPQERVVNIIQQIMKGFLEVVKAKIVHRDLKPSNILLTTENTIKIADFGFAIFQSQLSQEIKNNVGSTLYMPPEVLRKNIYSYKSDVWAIGVILYELLVGKKPWQTKNQESLHELITTIPIDLLIPESIQGNLREFMSRSLNPNLEKRSTPEQLMQILEADMLPINFQNKLRLQNPKKATKILVSMIDFCRLKYYIIQIIENQKQNKENQWKQIYQCKTFENLKKALSAHLLRELVQIQSLDYFTFEAKEIYIKSKDFKDLKEVINGYWKKYLPLYQKGKQIKNTSINSVLKICQQHISEDNAFINLVFYDYLICVKQLQRLISERGIQQFSAVSKINSLVESIKKQLTSEERKKIKASDVKILKSKFKQLQINE